MVNLPENILVSKDTYQDFKNVTDLIYPQSWNFFSPTPIMSNELLFAYCKSEGKIEKVDVYKEYILKTKKISTDITGDVAMSFRSIVEAFINDLASSRNLFCKQSPQCTLTKNQLLNIPSLFRIEDLARETCRSRSKDIEFEFAPIIRIEYAPYYSKSNNQIRVDEIELPLEKAYVN